MDGIVLGHADELMTREQVGQFLDRARATSPALVDEVVPGLLRAGEVQQVLQGLLRERVSVRDQETILETLAVHATRTKEIDVLIERVRRSLARRITQQYLNADGRLLVATLSRGLDLKLGMIGGLDDTRPAAALGAAVARSLIRAVAGALTTLIEGGHPPIVLCSAEARPVLKDLTRVDLPRLVVLSQREIPRDTPVDFIGEVVEDEIPVVTTYNTA
jgi:flagellar biosynthesis protein FlhA